MANPEHVEIVRKGNQALQDWQKSHTFQTLDLRGVNFEGLDLRRVNLEGANLMGANLRGADLRGADFSSKSEPFGDWSPPGATLANADLSNANLRDANFSEASFVEANLSLATLVDANLKCASLVRAKVSGAKASGVQLNSANLECADLIDADILGADLSNANLTGSNLTNADLRFTVLDRTVVKRANFSGSKWGRTICGSIDFSEATALENVAHEQPSTIGIDTIYASRGKIPDKFLLGCGVPESLIGMIPSLIEGLEPIQFYSCFISYSHKDEEFAKRLHGRLEQEKLRVWYAPEHMKAGQKIHEQIESAIRIHDKLLLVLSKESMKSQWVKTEIAHARQREVKEGKQVLFPISLVPFTKIQEWKNFDADIGKDSAKEIREYLIPDFSNWKDDDSFERGVEKLLKDLRQASE